MVAIGFFFPLILVLGCDGVVGSLSKFDECGVCQGDNSTCRLVSGLFTKPHLPPGYTHITTIPQGACSLNISFLRANNNHFALKTSDDFYIINKPGVLSLTGDFEGAATIFSYKRGNDVEKEILSSNGPIKGPIQLELFASDINRGVEYRYMVPISEEDQQLKAVKPGVKRSKEHKRRRSKSQYRWTLKTLTQCSRSCGGGYQRTLAFCVKKSGQRVVPVRKCEHWNKPAPRTVRCNKSPCSAEWIAGEWGLCSTTCGEGMQERRVACRQELSESLAIPVADELCTQTHKFFTQRKCYVKACDYGMDVLDSTVPPVLATQGQGDFRHLYQSYQANNKFDYLEQFKSESDNGKIYSGRKALKYFPDDPNLRYNNLSSDNQDENDLQNSQVELSADWVAQAWAACSVTCGSGVKERRVHCVDTRGGLVPDARCNILSRPDSEAYCSAGPCVTNTWLVSQWDVCSAQCGAGLVHRRVTCLGECDESTKPHTKEDCHAPKPCKGEWLTGRWTVCSHSCGEGLQSRKVECTIITEDGTQIAPEVSCSDRRKPKVERRCRIQKCSAEWFTAEWSKCSQECGEGEKTREVVCLDSYRMSEDCMRADRPERAEACQEQRCGDRDTNNEYGDTEEVDSMNGDNIIEYEDGDEEEYEVHEAEDAQSVEEITTAKPSLPPATVKHNSISSNEIVPEKHWKMVKGDGCKDKFKNCNVVVQSRLCKYSFYQTNCCRSCMLLNQP